jgi:predicted HTH domain antitoxin
MFNMAELTITYPDALLETSGKSREALEQEMKFQLAVRLFELGELSLGKAAEMAGQAKRQFADELGRLKVPLINLDEQEIEAEIRAGRGGL